MSEKLYEALEVCLQAMETGADIESVLRRYPEMANELRLVLEASVQARFLAAPSVPEAAMRRGRARLLQQAAGMREANRSSQRQLLSLPRLAASLALALIFILGGSGLVRASGGALPGDRLYPVKKSLEEMRLLLVFSPEEREDLQDEFEQKRLYEINELLLVGRYVRITFTGVVMEQNGDQWVVSRIPVQIMPESKLPIEDVTIGATIMLEGHTNAEGFVEADRVEILQPGISLPASKPTEIVDPKDDSRNNDTDSDQNVNADDDEIERETLQNDNDNSGEDSTDDNENNNSSDDGDDSDSNKGPGGGNNNNSNDDNDDSNDNDSRGDDDNDSGNDDD